MAELVTLARPYAVAAFSHARDKGRLAQWSDMLAFIVTLFRNERLRSALRNPQLTKDEVLRMLLAVCGENIDGAARNLLTVLAQNNRLDALPAIRDLFEELKAEHENEVEARIDSAFPLTAEQLRALVQKLEARTKRKVRASVQVRPELIGGVRVQVGDDLWDGSVRGQLETMASALTR